ncbi:hypothetical protein [Tichowtungia aerotolerans]|uniref:BACON domain-containing protein n=1 Tax=Tichowtungia aerotolerans TaxID=2697043 RepID=A0A6P1M8X0_9BACT|nr:hypothetical protein [Tichowtungia aerotolerans]QHI68026.1 hypothetical protein GT409_00690 [Tichowtungia aerotolerans]
MDSIKAGARKIGMDRWGCVFPLGRFFLARRGREFIAAALLFSCCAAFADTFQINSVAGSDGRVTEDGATVPNFMFVGNAFGNIPVAGVTMFQLPPLPPGHKVVQANLSMMMYWRFTTSFTFGLDLYGLRVDPSPAMAASDFYQGPYVGAAGRTPISSEFVPAGGTEGIYDLTGQATAQSDLAAWVQAQYDAGATNQYIFFCIAADQVAPEAKNYRFRAGNDAENPPLLTLVTEDLSFGPCDLVYPDSAPEQPAQKPGVTTNLTFVIQNDGYDATNVTIQLESNYPWLTVHSGSNAVAQILRGESVTNRFDVSIASNALPGVFSDAFALNMQGTGTDGSTSNFLVNVELEVLNTAFASIDKTSLSGDVADTDVAQLTISNTAGWALSYELSKSEAWLQVPSGILSLPAGAVTNIAVTADASLTPGQGQYTDTLQVTYNNNSSQPNPVAFELVFDVGPKISPLLLSTNAIVEAGGVNNLPGIYEPGEILEITVTSTNDGAIPVNSITNALVSESGWQVAPGTDLYAVMSVGDVTSTTYTVMIPLDAPDGEEAFTAKNTAGATFWELNFSISVFNRSIPSLTPGTIDLSVAEGHFASGVVVISNSGNAAFTFTVDDNASWGSIPTGSSAAVSPRETGGTVLLLNDPYPSIPTITAAESGQSDTRAIGFAFPFYGNVYTHFYVDSNGAIILTTEPVSGNMEIADNSTGALPLGNRPLIAPFRHVQLGIPEGSLRTIHQADRLVVVFDQVTLSGVSKETDLQFQAELFASGELKFSYYNISENQAAFAAVGVQGGSDQFENFGILPADGTALALALAENRWVSYSPTTGVVPGFGTASVVFTADGTGQAAGESSLFNTTFNWSSGGNDFVDVHAAVVAAVPVLAVSTNNLQLFAEAGQSVEGRFMVSNTGTAPLTYSISGDSNAASKQYGFEVFLTNSWVDIAAETNRIELQDPGVSPYINATNEGYSALLPIGFAFPFYDGSYTDLSVGVNGGISLGASGRIAAGNDLQTASPNVPDQFVAPYWGYLFMDENAAIYMSGDTNRLVVSWENMEQVGASFGSDISFQALLFSDGSVRFNYRNLNGISWPVTVAGVRSRLSSLTRFAGGVLTLPSDEVVIDINGFPRTNYVNEAAARSVRLQPSDEEYFTYTPVEGTLEPGSSDRISVIGNAATLIPSGTNQLVRNAQLEVSSEDDNEKDPVEVTVALIVTNSAPGSMPIDLLDADGDGMSYDEELIAGTDPLRADSVFSVAADGARDISWVAAPGRAYTVWYTLNLTEEFKPLEGAVGLTTNRFIDIIHVDVPAVYYKVTVD